MSIILTIFLIFMTGSRSALISSALIVVLSLPIISGILRYKFSKIIAIVLLGILISSDFVMQNKRVSYILDRFTQTSEGASLLENERYDVWSLLIQQFLAEIYYMVMVKKIF